MLKPQDALKLGFVKYEAKKGRSIFSGCAVSLGVILVMVFFLIISSVTNILSNAYNDSISERHLVQIWSWESYNRQDREGEVSEENFINEVDTIAQGYDVEKYTEYTVSKTNYFFTNQSEFNNDIPPANPMFFVNDIFAQDNLFRGESFDKPIGNNEPIPALVPISLLDELNNEDITGNALDPKEAYEQKAELVNEYKGKELQLSKLRFLDDARDQQNETLQPTTFESSGNNSTFPESADFSSSENRTRIQETDITVRVVGITGTLGSNSIGTGRQRHNLEGFVLPKWVLEDEQYRSQIITSPQEEEELVINYLYLEFLQKEQMSEFLDKYNATNEVGMLNLDNFDIFLVEYKGFIESFNEVKRVSTIVVGVFFGFLLLISSLFIFLTVGKLVADSRKEIGIFRAIGAEKGDISQIYFTYSSLITLTGFLIGFMIALFINTVLSLWRGEELFYWLVIASPKIDIAKPILTFVGLPILETLAILIIITLVGFLAALFPSFRASSIKPIEALRSE